MKKPKTGRPRVEPKHGGKRKGSGNKPKYGEPTATVAFRVPESKISEVKEVVKKQLKKYVLTDKQQGLSSQE